LRFDLGQGKVMDAIVVGAGISGLSTAICLQERGVIPTCFESRGSPGGLISCTYEDGSLFHRVGGHVFNTKLKAVNDWFWKRFDIKSEFIAAQRNAAILMGGKFLGYPIENYIYKLDERLQASIINELLSIGVTGGKQVNNFHDFLIESFGKTLCEIYFLPYNNKIWNADLTKVPLEWLNGKLPMPSIVEIFKANFSRSAEASMVHSTFYYPVRGGSQFIADRLASEVKNILYDSPVKRLEFSRDRIVINSMFSTKSLFWTGDLRLLVSLVEDESDRNMLSSCLKNFGSNGTSNLLCECDKTDYSWLYIPEQFTRAHRIIFTGNFSPNNNSPSLPVNRSTCTVEFSGLVTRNVAFNECKKLPFNLEPVAYNYEPNSYIYHNNNSVDMVEKIRKYFRSKGIYLVGRFAEWEYFNMDAAIHSAINTVDDFIKD